MTNPNGVLLILTIVIPAVFSIFALIRPIRRIVVFAVSVFVFYLAIRIFLISRVLPISFEIMRLNNISFSLYADTLSGFILMSIGLFASLISLYSSTALDDCPGNLLYPFYILLTLAAANGVALSHNLFLIIFFWGFLVAMLYAMMMISRKDPTNAAQKVFLIIGISDVFLLLGFIILFIKFGVSQITVVQLINFNQPFAVLTFILILIGILAKAGAMPLHSWIPEAAKVAPASTMAFIPASLDKLLGLYLLIRVSYFVFNLHGSMPLRMLLMIIGAITIVAAVMMAMVQKEAMKLLSFSTVSQVGYMVLGIGTGTPIGIAGALFHMINNTIYKSCLFLSVGSIERHSKTTEFEKLGGLSRNMPLTFLSFLVAALAISGVPPLNGFYSKWMIYQGIIELSRQTPLWPIFLISAMFGSILTLAYSLKMMHSLFLGVRPKALDKVNEARFEMVIPGVILALLCIVFGIFAVQVPLKFLIFPSLPFPIAGAGFWAPLVATILIIVALVIGGVIFLLGTAAKPRKSPVFVGGEILEDEESRIPGTEFYSSIKSFKFLSKLYSQGEAGVYDLYNLLTRFAEGVATIIFKYVDRVIDKLNYVIIDVVRFFSATLRSLISWCLILLIMPLLFYLVTGSLASLRIFAAMLLIGGPLIALTEDNLNKFLLAIAIGQLGLIVIGLGSGEMAGNSISLFQLVSSVLGLAIVYISIKIAVNLTDKKQVVEIQGLANNAGVASVGFIIGGLMLSALPPSVNFFSKFMASSLFEAHPWFILLIGISALLNLGAFLRIIRKVFLGPTNIKVQKRFGIEELLIVILIIISIFFVFRAAYFIRLFETNGVIL